MLNKTKKGISLSILSVIFIITCSSAWAQNERVLISLENLSNKSIPNHSLLLIEDKIITLGTSFLAQGESRNNIKRVLVVGTIIDIKKQTKQWNGIKTKNQMVTSKIRVRIVDIETGEIVYSKREKGSGQSLVDSLELTFEKFQKMI